MVEADTTSIEARPRHGLSKSRIAIFEQCAKRLWLATHRPELAAETDGAKRGFRIGHEVGDLACALVPGGIMIDGAQGMAEAARATMTAIVEPTRTPLFEATFIHEGVVVRVDLMIPDPAGWYVIEVKSTTSVKPYHRADLATQLWVLRGCGIAVSRASVRVINRTFVLRTKGNYDGLFIDEEVGASLSSQIEVRGELVMAARAVLASDEPLVPVGPHCTDPFSCAFDSYCNRDKTEPTWPVRLLPGVAGKSLARTLSDQGIDDLLAVEPGAVVHPLLRRVYAATTGDVAYHDAPAIRAEVSAWAYPRTFLDFETIGLAIPRWLATSPFQQVPFQFSAHIDTGGGQLAHREFLSIDGTDPRRACAAAMADLPGSGAVIAWNASFERSCLLQLASAVPEYGAPLRSLAERLVDLLPVARRHYYHRDMRGSWSIKAVLPTLAPELNYGALNGAQSGVEAQEAYFEAITPGTTATRLDELRRGLLAYCQLDTMAMVVALERLSEQE